MKSYLADTAKYLYKVVDDAKAFKGKPQEVVIAGCIFIACRQLKVPRTFAEISAATKVPKHKIGRIFKALEEFFVAENLGSRDCNPNDAYTATEFTKPGELCRRFCLVYHIE